MGAVSPDELAGQEMYPVWMDLDAVKGYHDAMVRYVTFNLPGSAKFDAAGMNEALRLAKEFNASWPHYMPKVWELVLADRAGILNMKVTELNAAYQGGQ